MQRLQGRKFWAIVLAVALALSGAAGIAPHAEAAPRPTAYTWKPLKIGGGGFVTGLVVHPTTPDLVYARTDVGGAYRWDEASQTWTQLIRADSVPNPTLASGADYNVESIAVSKTNDQVVLAAIGADGSWLKPEEGQGRILRSADRGQHWSASAQRFWIAGNGDFRTGGERLAVDPNNGSVVYFGSRLQGLWRSGDGAATWTQVPTTTIPVGNSPVGVKFVLFDQTSAVTGGKTSRIYAGVAGQGVYRSDDAGASWTNVFSTAQIPYDAEVASDGALYVGFSATSGPGMVQKYDPSAGSWANISPNSGQNYWELAVDPFNPQRVIAAPGGVSDGNLWRTTDGGASWDTLNIALDSPDIPWILHTDEAGYMSSASLSFDPHARDRLWFPQGTGVWRTSDVNDGEITWTFVSKGIEEMVTTDVIAPYRGVPVTTVYDRQGFYHPDPDAYPARPLLDDQFWGGSSLNYSGQNPNFIVTAQVKNNYYPSLTGRGAFSRDGGKTWTRFASQPADSVGGNIAVSATDPSNIVWLPSTGDFGQGKLPYYTTDLGGSWAKSGGYSGINTHWLFWWGSKRALDADKVAGGTFYLVTFDGTGAFYVSTDGGAHFGKAANAPVCSSDDDCHVFGQVHAVPGKAGHVWSSDAKGGLYYTTDAGATAWVKVPGVQDARAFGFGRTLDGDYPAVYLYGKANGETSFALWRSGDRGATWKKIADAPGGIYDSVSAVSGDMNIAGRVYVGFGGNSFVYGDDPRIGTRRPSRPILVEAAPANQSVRLSWTAEIGATGYQVTYKPRKGQSVTVDVGNITDYTVSGLTNGMRYTFTVAASNAKGDSGRSNALSATPTASTPQAPQLAAPVAGSKSVTLTWTGAGDAAGYRLKYGTTPGSYTTVIDVGSATSYTVQGLANGTTYYFAVAGYNGNGDGANSNEQSATPQGPPPPRITADAAAASPTIDGRLDEADWHLTTSITKTVSGAFNNTASFGVTWDSAYLYVGVKVLDASLKNDSSDPWADDSVEVYIDGNYDRAETYNPTYDRQIVQGWGDNTLWEQHGKTSGVLHAWAPTDGGYTVELAIPWSNLNITPATGGKIGLDVAVNDDDDGGDRDGQNVAFGMATNYADQSALGEATLAGTPIDGPPPPPPPPATGLTVYDDAVGSGWYAFTWGATSDMQNASPVHGGAASIAITYTDGWGAEAFGRWQPPVDTAGYTALHFWIHGGSEPGTRHVQVHTNTAADGSGVSSPAIAVDAPANTWTEVTIPLSDLGGPGQIGRIIIQDRTGGAQPQLFVDDIALVSGG